MFSSSRRRCFCFGRGSGVSSMFWTSVVQVVEQMNRKLDRTRLKTTHCRVGLIFYKMHRLKRGGHSERDPEMYVVLLGGTGTGSSLNNSSSSVKSGGVADRNTLSSSPHSSQHHLPPAVSSTSGGGGGGGFKPNVYNPQADDSNNLDGNQSSLFICLYHKYDGSSDNK